MNILLTGASGFVGSQIYNELTRNYTVTTLGRTPVGAHHLTGDLTGSLPSLAHLSFDYVVNAAGKAHAIPRTAAERADYASVNRQGVARLLATLEQMPVRPRAFVHLSTVLVYGCLNGQLLDETTPLAATDAYGESKIQAELIIREWAQRTGIRATILRLPMVVSAQPTGNVAALMNAIRQGYYVRIGNGLARRSMVRADDVAAIIDRAAGVGGTFNVTDGYHACVSELENAIARYVGHKQPIRAVPLALARLIALAGDGINTVAGRRFPLDTPALQKLTQSLTFSDGLARQQLGWNPRPVLDLFR
ncbi:NAD-dependent epimerase/dehydratase family protein [Spirosoma utsteinense]|uniref:Nucleoside-diphosphate-sugar epimerase n=1 Tax=Spirosoma utsteinense TaxID=2585773 RepID=A0ABR6W6S3_9BACT|nr:NAD-dependent epimerase/dehydratase family protein [Spirosoma utsteinense]MBC3786089.1 nucleoside-diphosphate-sugar epimerase [Spirosoma utsteinense]MBC3792278.1 nucleoside-diphosphate-sugar epimerase [Spirosoma utsteinense]